MADDDRARIYFCKVHGDVAVATVRVMHKRHQWWCESCQKWIDAQPGPKLIGTR